MLLPSYLYESSAIDRGGTRERNGRLFVEDDIERNSASRRELYRGLKRFLDFSDSILCVNDISEHAHHSSSKEDFTLSLQRASTSSTERFWSQRCEWTGSDATRLFVMSMTEQLNRRVREV